MRDTCIQRFIVCGRDSGESARHLLREVCVGAMSACAEESLLGSVRSEALLTDRAAHYVCYPGNGSRDRIITVRETEHGIAMSLLKVCQTYPCKGKLELQRVCQIARGAPPRCLRARRHCSFACWTRRRSGGGCAGGPGGCAGGPGGCAGGPGRRWHSMRCSHRDRS